MAAAGTTLAAVPASAADLGSWTRSTTGAKGSGKFVTENGYIRNRIAVEDTAADGHCVYARTQLQGFIGAVWITGETFQSRICGRGSSIHQVVSKNIDLFTGASRIRGTVKVCREDGGPDTCSDIFVSEYAPR